MRLVLVTLVLDIVAARLGGADNVLRGSHGLLESCWFGFEVLVCDENERLSA